MRVSLSNSIIVLEWMVAKQIEVTVEMAEQESNNKLMLTSSIDATIAGSDDDVMTNLNVIDLITTADSTKRNYEMVIARKMDFMHS